MKPSRVKLFLEGRKAQKKQKKYRKKFSTIKAIAYDMNEIWSLDLSHLEKLAEERKGLKYFLVEVDSLSRYLRVKPWKSKYARSAAEEEVWVDADMNFEGSFSPLCQKKKLKFIKKFSTKKIAFAEK